MSCPTSTHTQNTVNRKYKKTAKLGVLMGTDSDQSTSVPGKNKPKAFSEKLKNLRAPGNLALVTGRGREGKSIAVPFLPARVNAAPPSASMDRGLPPRWEVSVKARLSFG